MLYAVDGMFRNVYVILNMLKNIRLMLGMVIHTFIQELGHKERERERKLCDFKVSLTLLSKFQVSQGLYSKILSQRKKGG